MGDPTGLVRWLGVADELDDVTVKWLEPFVDLAALLLLLPLLLDGCGDVADDDEADPDAEPDVDGFTIYFLWPASSFLCSSGPLLAEPLALLAEYLMLFDVALLMALKCSCDIPLLFPAVGWVADSITCIGSIMEIVQRVKRPDGSSLVGDNK